MTSFTANTTFPIAAGTPVTWTATATGGAAPLQYQFHLYDPNTGWRVLQGYGVANTVTWTPLHPGDYALQVWVRAPGSTATYDAWAPSGTATITAGPVSVVSLAADRLLPLATGTTVTWTAAAAGGSTPLEYRFLYYRASLGTWVEGQAYGPSATWTWTPPAADTYVVQVWVRTVGPRPATRPGAGRTTSKSRAGRCRGCR